MRQQILCYTKYFEMVYQSDVFQSIALYMLLPCHRVLHLRALFQNLASGICMDKLHTRSLQHLKYKQGKHNVRPCG